MTVSLSALALAVFLGFVGVLVWRVPSPDLVVVVALTAAAAGWDLIRYRGKG